MSEEPEEIAPVPGRRYKVTRIFMNKKGQLERKWREMVCIESPKQARMVHVGIRWNKPRLLVFVSPNASKKLIGVVIHPADYTSISKSIGVVRKDYPLWTRPPALKLSHVRDHIRSTTPNEMIIFEEISGEKTLGVDGQLEEEPDIKIKSQEEKWKRKYPS